VVCCHVKPSGELPHIAGVTGDEVDATVNVELIAERLELVLIARGKRRRGRSRGSKSTASVEDHTSALATPVLYPPTRKSLDPSWVTAVLARRGENAAAAGAERPSHAVGRRPNIIAVADDIRAADQPEAILEGDQGGPPLVPRKPGESGFLRPGDAIRRHPDIVENISAVVAADQPQLPVVDGHTERAPRGRTPLQA